MRYQFNEFEFNSESLLLSHNGQTIAIRHVEARVLAVLLEYKYKVLTKDDILSLVWKNKVVSEQVVFQNVSHLRSLFGQQAIKTFPKLGYQWQFDTLILSADSHACDHSDSRTPASSYASLVSSSDNEIAVQKQRNSDAEYFQYRPLNKILIKLFFLSVLVTTFYFFSNEQQENNHSVIQLAYAPFTFKGDSISRIDEEFVLEDSEYIGFIELGNINTDDFEANSTIEYLKRADKHPFILTGNVRTFENTTYLDFTLQGPVSNWQGQLSGASLPAVTSKLKKHLSHQVIYDLLSHEQSAELTQAKLSIAYQTSPNDLIFLQNLSVIYLSTDQLDKAMAMTDRLVTLAKNQDDFQQLGSGLIYQSKTLTRKKLYQLSSEKLNQAMMNFEKINDLKQQARVWYYRSWLDDEANDYLAIRKSLLTSAELAFRAENKVGEVEAYIFLAVMSDKYNNERDTFFYLKKAEDKINEYQLAQYHAAKIPFHHASFVSVAAEKELHLKRALHLSKATPQHWVAKVSRKQLVKSYLVNNRLEDAYELINQLTVNSGHKAYLQTLLLQAENKIKPMILKAQQTFEQAQLSGHLIMSLDAALILCEQQVNYDFYVQYIAEHSSVGWREVNKTKLRTLNL